MTMLESLSSELDESIDADGSLREPWSPVVTALDNFDAAQIAAHQNELQRRYRENGLAYGTARRRKANQRPWNLDLMPQMMSEGDWKVLDSGLQQRARLKSALLKDLYGEQRVLHEGVIPPKAVFAHKGFLLDAVGLPAFDTLPLYSADVSRAPSGDWYVSDDVTQAQNGLGHTLENRLILSGVLSDLYRESHVRRVAEFFKHMRNLLFRELDNDARCVILGYGASHHFHFEQAYLARYLGYTLVQINDLTVRGKHVWLKTVDGLHRIDVIFRFVEDADIDPLAGDASNISGVPGLLHAAREGAVKVINPIGSGAIENPAFNVWLPELCSFLLNEEIELLSTPTYWLGDNEHWQLVQERFDSLLFRDIDTSSELLDPCLMGESQIDELRKRIELQPETFVAQERIDRSSTPSLTTESVELRHLTMRTFLMSSSEGFRTLPGGLGLLDSQTGGGRPKTLDMISSKDVWVVSSTSVPYVTLLGQSESGASFNITVGELPSSVAESLFWLGRYAERIESSVRVLLSVCLHLRSDERFVDEKYTKASLATLLKASTEITGTLPGFVGKGGQEKINDPDRELISLLSDSERIGSIPNTLENLSLSAAMVRDRLSGDMFRAINSLDDHHADLKFLQQAGTRLDGIPLTKTIEKLNDLLISLAAFTGLSRENMTQGVGWRFHQIGKRLERASQTSKLVSLVFSDNRDNNYALEDLLNTLCCAMTYRSRYRTLLVPTLVFNLVVADQSNPRSLGYQLKDLENLIRLLPGRRIDDSQEPAMRAATEGVARIRLIEPDNLFEDDSQTLIQFFTSMKTIPADIATALSAQYFTHTEMPNILYSGFDSIDRTSASDSDSGENHAGDSESGLHK